MKSKLRKHLLFSKMGFALSLGLLFLATGCAVPSTPATASASSPSTPSSVSVAINPLTATVLEGGSLPFVATVKGAANATVAWSVQEGTTGGSITTLGVYTAPNTVGTYHVVATSAADPTASATAAVTIEQPPVISSSVSVAISPLTVTVAEAGSLSFVATVKGAANSTVTWSIQEGATGGSITSSGLYTAPNTSGTYHVVATSVADATASASAVVTIEPPVTSTAAGNFTAVGNMNTARADHTATLLPNGKVLIAGGSGEGFQDLASAELYDPSTRTFTPTGSMITPRYAHSATLLADGRVLIAGGTQNVNAGTFVFTAEIYDPSTGVFTATGDLSSIGGAVYALPGNVVTLLSDGRVFVVASNNAEIYDPHSGTFTPTGPYVEPSLVDGTTVTLLTNGKVLVTGCAGYCAAGVAELFDPQSGTFGVTGPMTVNYFPDYGYTATLLADGRVLFLGSNDWPFPGDAEVYDPATGTFASIGGAVSQELAPASRLTDGTVLIAGGQLVGGNGSADAQLYVPVNGAFEFAGEMTAGRHEHTATPLPDDTVLITGGYSVWPHPTSSAEVYKPR
jgi:putative Ca2+/H+ antiporter (TMEM165/GDT1 family)